MLEDTSVAAARNLLIFLEGWYISFSAGRVSGVVGHFLEWLHGQWLLHDKVRYASLTTPNSLSSPQPDLAYSAALQAS